VSLVNRRPRRPGGLATLVAAWGFAILSLAVVAVRWDGWADATGRLVGVRIIVGFSVALAAVSAAGVFRSFVEQLAASRAMARSISDRALPVPAWLKADLAAAGITRSLLVANPAARAFTFGLLAPTVVLTTGVLARLERGALRALLEHEAMHARRRDPLRLLLAQALTAGLFGVAPAAKARERCRQATELVADHIVVQRLGVQPLADALLALARGDARSAPSLRAPLSEATALLGLRVRQLARASEDIKPPPASLGERLLVAVPAMLLGLAATIPCAFVVGALALL
jgi:beta-lactamase regulating signal transducer with metallopeptidase domain